MSPAAEGPGLASLNQACRQFGPLARLEASTAIDRPVGAVPRLTQSAGRSGEADAPGVPAGGVTGVAAGGGGGGAATVGTPQPSSACLVSTPTFGSCTSPAT